MGEDQQRLFLTITICFGIMLVWTWLFAPEPAPQHTGSAPAAAQQTQTGASDAPQKATGQGATPSGQPPASAAPVAAPETEVVREIPGLYRIALSSLGARMKSFELLGPRYIVRDGEGGVRPVDMVPAKGANHMPLELVLEEDQPTLSYTVAEESERRVRLVAEHPGVRRVEKTFTFHDGRYTIDLEATVTNLSDRSTTLKPSLRTTSYQDPEDDGGGLLAGLPNLKEAVDVIGGEVERETTDDLTPSFEDRVGVVSFVGWNDRYFVFAMRPRDVETAQVAHRALGDGVFESALTLPADKIAPGQSATHRFSIYVGPKEIETLQSEGDELYQSVDFWVVGAIARPMLGLMKIFYGWVGNWGLAIILLTLIVKLVLLPLTNKSFKSMKAMQKVKPKMDKLREKYAADKERLNQEMLNLYRTHKINPLAGCLPMFLQMPVWIALYRTIWSSVELYQAQFLWLNDLSSEDPTYVLPLLLGVVTFVQQRLQPVQMDATQQKMMMWMMPIMFTAFMLFLPSALVLYIFCNSLLTIVQQWYIKRGDA